MGRWFFCDVRCGFPFGYDQSFEIGVMSCDRDAAIQIINTAVAEKWGYNMNDSPRSDTSVVLVLQIHFVIVYHHIPIPGSSLTHEAIPLRFPLFRGDKLTQSVKGLKSASRFPTTLQNKRGDGDINTMLHMKFLMRDQSAGIYQQRTFWGYHAVI